MEVPEHMAVIAEQIEAMRADGHDANTLISIQLDALEYATEKIIVLDLENRQDKY